MSDLNKQWESMCEEYHRRKFLRPPSSEIEAKTEEFIDNFVTEGRRPCDETNETFNEQFQLPPFYDENLFKKGQAFFHKHFVAMIFGKILGLAFLLSTPGANVMTMTKKSSTPYAAFKRYIATIMHTLAWYQGDCTPGSKLWISLRSVRSMHNSASKKSTAKWNYSINQMEMASSMFAFMGFAVTRSEKIGIYNATKDELKAFIHFWRVIGYMLGIEDKFNICRDSVDETVAINEAILNKFYKPLIENPSKNFQILTFALLEGLKNIFWWSDTDVYIHYLHMIVDDTDDVDLKKDCLKPLTATQKSTLKNTIYYFSLYRFQVFRIIVNNVLILLYKFFPFFLVLKNVKVNLAEIVN